MKKPSILIVVIAVFLLVGCVAVDLSAGPNADTHLETAKGKNQIATQVVGITQTAGAISADSMRTQQAYQSTVDVANANTASTKAAVNSLVYQTMGSSANQVIPLILYISVGVLLALAIGMAIYYIRVLPYRKAMAPIGDVTGPMITVINPVNGFQLNARTDEVQGTLATGDEGTKQFLIDPDVAAETNNIKQVAPHIPAIANAAARGQDTEKLLGFATNILGHAIDRFGSSRSNGGNEIVKRDQ
jgi:hypothetical protein